MSDDDGAPSLSCSMAQSVSQLEGELRAMSERLLKTLNEKEAVEKDLENLRIEAHDVIRQWEEENDRLRRRLYAAQTHIESMGGRAANDESQEARPTSIEEEDEKSQLHTVTQMSHVTHLHERDAEELIQHRAAVAQMRADMEALRSQLGNAQEEAGSLARALKQQADCMDAERQSYKEEKAALEQNNERALEHARAQLKENEDKLNSMSANLVACEQDASRLRCECVSLVSRIDVMSKRTLSNEQSMQDQMDVIKSLENDVRCQRELYQAMKDKLARAQSESICVLEEAESLRSSNQSMSSELGRVQRTNEELLLQLEQVRESKSSALSAMTCEVDALKLALVEQSGRYRAEVDALTQRGRTLLGDCSSLKLELLNQCEETARLNIASAHSEGALPIYSICYQSTRAMIDRAVAVSGKIREALSDADAARDYLKTTNDSLCLQLRSAQADVEQLRSANSALEGALDEANEEVKALGRSQRVLELEKSHMQERACAMREELAHMDELLNTSLDSMREENERTCAEVHRLNNEIDDSRKVIDELQEQVRGLTHEKASAHSDNVALLEMVELTKASLSSAHKNCQALRDELDHAQSELRTNEKHAKKQQHSMNQLKSDVACLTNQIIAAESRAKTALEEKANEVLDLQARLRDAIDRAEQSDMRAANSEDKVCQVQSSLVATKDSYVKVKSAFDKLRERCASDAELIKRLVLERDEVIQDRDTIVERYNRLHDNFGAWRKKLTEKVSAELRNLIRLCTGQESELLCLRHENKILKNSISMFISTAQPKAEAVFTERLNLTEGPRRHPKKWTSTVPDISDQHTHGDSIAEAPVKDGPLV